MDSCYGFGVKEGGKVGGDVGFGIKFEGLIREGEDIGVMVGGLGC